MDQLQALVYGLVPSLGIGFLFYKIMRAILEGDRNERLAHSQWEARQDETVKPPPSAEIVEIPPVST